MSYLADWIQAFRLKGKGNLIILELESLQCQNTTL